MSSEAGSDAPLAGAPSEPPRPDPLVGLPQGGGRLLSTSFDLLVGASVDLRRASFYIGAVLVLTVGPLALLLLGLALHDETIVEALRGDYGPSLGITQNAALRLQEATSVVVLVAVAGYLVVAVESQAIAIGTLAGRLSGRPLSRQEAVVRSRAVFWRLVRGTLIAGLPVGIVQLVVQTALSSGGQLSQGGALLATAAGTLVGVPFVYVGSGIVLGEVLPLEAVRRSFRLARFRLGTAAIVAVFAALAQYLLVFGVGVGADAVSRLATFLDVGSGTPPAIALMVLGASGFVLALGTLVFTVTAISVAPQVVAFLALTRYTGGLDRARSDARAQSRYGRPAVDSASSASDGGRPAGVEGQPTLTDGARPTYWVVVPVHRPPRFRWLTRPLLAGVALAVVSMAAGLVAAQAS